MVDIILILIIAAVVGAAIAYIVKEKKKGTACIGCPMAGKCSKQQGGNGGCSCSGEEK